MCDVQLIAQVLIIDEETPLHIPRDAFGLLASVPVFQSGKVPRAVVTSPLAYELSDDETVELEVSDSDSGTEEERVLRRWAMLSAQQLCVPHTFRTSKI